MKNIKIVQTQLQLQNLLNKEQNIFIDFQIW
jgi:hypothetical protein